MRDNNSFYDIFCIFHPADFDRVERIAAQIRATGINTRLPEDEFGQSADGIKQLKNDILRSYAVAFALSPDSAESQLCNELLQYAVSKGKTLATLILNDAIKVEVHPSIAQNPYVFFREDDDLAARVDELRAYLRSDDHLKRHTELLVRAENWRERGRPPDLLLPPDRLDETRDWLASASARHPKPTALQLEYVHSSRRQPPRRRPARPLPILAGIAVVIALAFILLLLQRGVASWQAQRVAGAQVYEAQTQAGAQATAASDSAVGLIDQVAATGAVVRTAVAQNATVESITATAFARVTQTAQARSDMRATQLRITEIAALEKDDVAQRLVLAGEEARARGEIELALALAWEAKSGLDEPGSAYRLLRRAAAARRAVTIDDVSLLRIHPAGEVFALVPGSRDTLRIYDGDSWSLLNEWSDHEAEITILVYGDRLISASDDGEIIVRDGLTGTAEQQLHRHRDAITALALAPDSRTLYSAGRDGLLVAWDIDSGAELTVYQADDESDLEIHNLLVSADGERVIGWYASDGREMMAQWSAHRLELLSADSGGRVYGGVDAQGRIGYSGGGSLPAYPGDRNTGDLILWDLSSGGQIARLTDGFNWSFLSGDGLAAGTDDLRFVAFSENLALAVAENSGEGQRASLVNATDGRLLRRVEGEIAANVTSATFIDEETILSATSDNRVLLWSSGDGRLIREIGATTQDIRDIQVNPAANLVVVGTADGASHLWEFEDEAAEPLLTLRDALPGTSISPSGDAILLLEDEGLSLRDAASGETLLQLPADLVSHAGAHFAVYADDRLSVHDFETGAEVRGWDWAGQLLDLHLAPDGEQLLAAGATGELWLFRRGTDTPQQLAEAAERPALVRFAPAGDAILSLQGEQARLWDSELGLARAVLPLGTGDYADVQAAFSEDGGSVIFYVQLEEGLAGLTIVDLAENEARRQTYVDVQSAALASDGEQLSLVYRDGRTVVVSTRSGAIIHEINAETGDALKLQYLPEPSALAVAIGSELILWDAEAGAIDQVFAHRQRLADFSISRDGRRILTADENGVLRLWQVESAEALLARIEADHKPRNLTCAERERYLAPPLCV